MDPPRMVTLSCPACGDQVDVVIEARAPVGTVGKRECPEGHVFWYRLDPIKVEVLSEPPE